MMRYTFIGMVEDSLSAREARVLRECSAKKASELSDEMMSEFSEIAQKAKATLLANITTLSIDRLMTLLAVNRGSSNINELLLFGKELVSKGFTGIGNFLNQKNAKETAETIALGYFGEMIKGDFTGKEFDEFFALVKARSEYIDGKNDDFDDKKESRLDELANKAKGIIIGKIEPLEATAIF